MDACHGGETTCRLLAAHSKLAAMDGLHMEIEAISAVSAPLAASAAGDQMSIHADRDASGGGTWPQEEAELGLFDAFFASLSMILVSEVLSTGLGRIVPNLISRKHTNSAATASPQACP